MFGPVTPFPEPLVGLGRTGLGPAPTLSLESKKTGVVSAALRAGKARATTAHVASASSAWRARRFGDGGAGMGGPPGVVGHHWSMTARGNAVRGKPPRRWRIPRC